MKKLLSLLQCTAASRWYWLGLLVFALAMEGVALYYQYALDYGPCVHCIHVRLWLLAMMALALPALWLRKVGWINALLHAGVAGLMVGMLLTSQQLLGTERGTIFGSCNFDAGLPSWLALDKWFPAIFGVKEACGYTPELLFHVTMAEALVALSYALIALALLMMVLSLAGLRR